MKLKSSYQLFLSVLFILFTINFTYSQTETILIDFGSSGANESVSPWNNITNNVSGSINNLINNNSNSSGIDIEITDGFQGINTNGTNTPDAGLNFLGSATSDSFFGTTSDSGALILKNLVVGKQYTITFFASRLSVGDNRETDYEIVGQNTQTVSLDASNNTSNSISATFYSKTDGTAIINVSPGSNNNNSSGYFYLGVLKLEYLTNAPNYSDNALLIDFGPNTNETSNPWNNVTDAANLGTVNDLINKSGATTNIDLSVTDVFNFTNENGTTSSGESLGLPDTVTSDSFFGNNVEFQTKTEPTGAIELSNFNPNVDLNFTVYASRIDYTNIDNRETQYVIEGLTTTTLYLNPANNKNNSVSTTIKPKADGTISITASAGPNNTNTYGFFYLGAMVIDYTPQPTLTLNYPNGNEFWQVGKTPSITWNSTDLTSDINLEYSTDNGSNWSAIATVSNTVNSYNWTIPNNASTNCLVRATSGSTTDTSDATFEISTDNSTCNIVVLGSSTAEGTGASVPSNAWVNLYSTDIFQKNTKLNVINLAKGGYTTYHILPTGTTIPGGLTIDTERNITKALSFSPVAIIVNMPSNDTSNGYSAATQLSNFATLNTEASNNSVPIWIATTQPRNFGAPAQIQTQIDVRDGIIATYGANAIDFWTDIAETDGTILSSLNSGDGVHLNDNGHALLFNKVKAKNIDGLTCTGSTLGADLNSVNDFSMRVYPNPVKDMLYLSFNIPHNGEFTIELYDSVGRQLLKDSSSFTIGNNIHSLSLKSMNTQLIFGKITFESINGSTQKQFKVIVK